MIRIGKILLETILYAFRNQGPSFINHQTLIFLLEDEKKGKTSQNDAIHAPVHPMSSCKKIKTAMQKDIQHSIVHR